MGKCTSKPETKREHQKPLLTSSLPTNSPEFRTLKHIPSFPVNPVAKSLITNALLKNHLFNDLSIPDIERLFKCIQFCVAEENQLIFEQGSVGTLFFIINSGRVQVIVDEKKKGILKQEDCFGEMALLSDSTRKASIFTLCKSSFWVLSRDAFCRALQDLFKKSYDQIRKLISETLFFKNFPDNQLDAISKLAVKESYNDQQLIVREGDEGEMLYILKKGCVVFKKGIDEFLRINKIGEMFGEGSLLTGEKRQATCMAIGQTEVISINRINMKSVFGENYDEIMLKNVSKNSILSDPHLGFLDKSKVIDICMSLRWHRYNEGELVIRKNYEHLSMFRVICSGSIKTKCSTPSCVRSYQVIGMGNLLEKSLKRKNYYSVGKAIIGEVEIHEIDKKLNMDTKQLFESLDKAKFLSNISFFSCLSLDSIKIVCSNMKAYLVTKDTKIFEYNDQSKKLYMVRSGTFEIYQQSGSTIRIVLKNEIFGERCLYEKKRSASVICTESGEIYAINSKILMTLPEIKTLLIDAKRKEYYQKQIFLPNMMVVSEQITSFGRKKYCLKDPNDKSKYNLIVVPKNTLDTKADCFRIVNERNIMIQIEHRMLVKMVCSSVDENNIYFITEHVKGKALRQLFPINEEFAKVLFLHFVKILEYLHSKDIVYRDFCTENLIVDVKGVPHLFNFQYAKQVPNRTYSRVGTPHCRSPEMIMGRGYTKSTDIWSLGVILFEITYGFLPFKIDISDSPVDIYEKVLKIKHGVLPNKDLCLNELILGMLSPAANRFGFEVILRNLWFSNINKSKIFKQRPSKAEDVLKKELKQKKHYKKTFKASRIMTQLNQIQSQPEVEDFLWDKYF